LRPDAGKGARSRRTGSAKRHTGFTLVEVIVVLVILAILAAIAIPALTGYIEKAEDKQYIADARNHMVALRTVLNEAYSTGEVFSQSQAKNWFINGEKKGNIKFFNTYYLSLYATGNNMTYRNQATALIAHADYRWDAYTFAEYGSDDTALSARGFWYEYYPEGQAAGNPEIIVTYKLDRLPSVTTHTEFNNAVKALGQYSEDAGYEIYRVTN
jgi:prepilin-type N-terminal cleavage/methylation domain-containing protein